MTECTIEADLDKWDAYAHYTAKTLDIGELTKFLLLPGYATYALAKITNRRHKSEKLPWSISVVDYTVNVIPGGLFLDAVKIAGYIKLGEFLLKYF